MTGTQGLKRTERRENGQPLMVMKLNRFGWEQRERMGEEKERWRGGVGPGRCCRPSVVVAGGGNRAGWGGAAMCSLSAGKITQRMKCTGGRR